MRLREEDIKATLGFLFVASTLVLVSFLIANEHFKTKAKQGKPNAIRWMSYSVRKRIGIVIQLIILLWTIALMKTLFA